MTPKWSWPLSPYFILHQTVQNWTSNGPKWTRNGSKIREIKKSDEFSKFELLLTKINYWLSSLLISCRIKRITEMTKKIISLDFITFIVRLFLVRLCDANELIREVLYQLHFCWLQMIGTDQIGNALNVSLLNSTIMPPKCHSNKRFRFVYVITSMLVTDVGDEF